MTSTTDTTVDAASLSTSGPNTSTSASTSRSSRTPVIRTDTPLHYSVDSYQCVTIVVPPVSASESPDDNEVAAFERDLTESMAAWRAAQLRGLWLVLPHDRAALVPVAVRAGFRFHSADSAQGRLTMAGWLPPITESTPCTLPPGATHQVGVGGVVVRASDGHILVVRERSGPAMNLGWKIPTGLVNLGEEIHEAAVREVQEETGVNTTFERMLCLRHKHGVLFGKDDLFFVCQLSVTAEDAERPLVPQESEIADATWISLDDLEKQPIFQRGYPKRLLELVRSMQRGEYAGLEAISVPSVVGRGTEWVYEGFPISRGSRADGRAAE